MGLFKSEKTNYFSWYTRKEGQHYSPEIGQVYIELSTFCNFSCEACMRMEISDFKPKHFSLKSMNKLLPMLKELPQLKRIVLLGFGESMCNPEFENLLKMLKSVYVDIVMVTNLSLCNDSTILFISDLPVDEVWVSWDDSLNGDGSPIRKGSSAINFKRSIESLIIKKNSFHRIKKVGLEIVASKMNLSAMPEIFLYAASIGIDECIITNVFPYSERMQNEILYAIYDKSIPPNLKKLIPKKAHGLKIKFPAMVADRPRMCPFIEKGTIFVTSFGDVAPCPELAYTHPAYYFGSKRIHKNHIFGSITLNSITKIWHTDDFISFRENFKYYEFPDCSCCRDPNMCWHRTVDEKDCFGFTSPCGECLWAKGIVMCP